MRKTRASRAGYCILASSGASPSRDRPVGPVIAWGVMGALVGLWDRRWSGLIIDEIAPTDEAPVMQS